MFEFLDCLCIGSLLNILLKTTQKRKWLITFAYERDLVISCLYEQIQNRDIWIPYGEIKKYVYSKTTKIVKYFKKQFPDLSEEIEGEHTKASKNPIIEID